MKLFIFAGFIDYVSMHPAVLELIAVHSNCFWKNMAYSFLEILWIRANGTSFASMFLPSFLLTGGFELTIALNMKKAHFT